MNTDYVREYFRLVAAVVKNFPSRLTERFSCPECDGDFEAVYHARIDYLIETSGSSAVSMQETCFLKSVSLRDKSEADCKIKVKPGEIFHSVKDTRRRLGEGEAIISFRVKRRHAGTTGQDCAFTRSLRKRSRNSFMIQITSDFSQYADYPLVDSKFTRVYLHLDIGEKPKMPLLKGTSKSSLNYDPGCGFGNDGLLNSQEYNAPQIECETKLKLTFRITTGWWRHFKTPTLK